MQYTTLGRSGLKVSVAGLGCGGNSKLGLGTGHDKAHAVGIVQRALDLGVNFIDTAQYYGTEAAVGEAIYGRPRDSIVISTKHKVSLIDGTVFSVAEILAGLDRSLRALGTDHVDVFCLHTVLPQEYDRVMAEIVPALLREKEAGKFRYLGITEFAGRDPRHDTLARATADDCWDVMMVAFHMLNQNARQRVFPATRAKNIGTLLMFAVRAIFSVPGRLQRDITELAAEGKVPKWLADKKTRWIFYCMKTARATSSKPPTVMHAMNPAPTSCCSAPAIPITSRPTSTPSCSHRCRPTMHRKSWNSSASWKVSGSTKSLPSADARA